MLWKILSTLPSQNVAALQAPHYFVHLNERCYQRYELGINCIAFNKIFTEGEEIKANRCFEANSST